MRHWQPLGAKTIVTCSLLNPENQRQRSINRFCSSTFQNQGITRIFKHITELLPTLIAKNAIYHRKNTDSKLIDITSCKASKKVLLVVEYTILIRYYYQTAKTQALYESIDGPAGRPAHNPPNSEGLGDYHQTIPEFTVQVD